MACVSDTGELTPSGRTMLESLLEPLEPEALARAAGLPLYRVRAALREFTAAGLVEEVAGRWVATPAARERLAVRN